MSWQEKIVDCSNPYGCRRQASFDEWHANMTAENEHLRAVLAACQKALREMQAQRDKAREGKR